MKIPGVWMIPLLWIGAATIDAEPLPPLMPGPAERLLAFKPEQKAPDSKEPQKNTPAADRPGVDIRADLAGTTWKATPSLAPLRPGLAGHLEFNGKTVAPAGYRYDVNSHDGTVTIYFNHGDSQLMLLTDNGKRLRFTFRGKDYFYELASKFSAKD